MPKPTEQQDSVRIDDAASAAVSAGAVLRMPRQVPIQFVEIHALSGYTEAMSLLTLFASFACAMWSAIAVMKQPSGFLIFVAAGLTLVAAIYGFIAKRRHDEMNADTIDLPLGTTAEVLRSHVGGRHASSKGKTRADDA